MYQKRNSVKLQIGQTLELHIVGAGWGSVYMLPPSAYRENCFYGDEQYDYL